MTAPPGHPGVGRPDEPDQRIGGFLAVEWVATLPVLVLFGSLLVAAGFLVRDVLVIEEAARVGARVASVTTGAAEVVAAARAAAPEVPGLTVTVWPADRRPGDDVRVEVTAVRRYGPLRHQLSARRVARVEPVVGSAVDGRRPP